MPAILLTAVWSYAAGYALPLLSGSGAWEQVATSGQRAIRLARSAPGSAEAAALPFLTRMEYDGAVEIIEQVVNALRKEDAEYHGTLYGQFMLTKNGPKVIEFNARFGDPEAMNVLSLLSSDFVQICAKMAEGGISRKHAEFKKKAFVCKYVVPEGYGTKSLACEEIKVDEKGILNEGALLYYASVNERMEGFSPLPAGPSESWE